MFQVTELNAQTAVFDAPMAAGAIWCCCCYFCTSTGS